MAGCFGSHPEDRARERELNQYLDKQYGQQERIDQRADDIYRAKLAALPVSYCTTSMGTKLIGLDDAIDNFYGKSLDGIALACAIRDGDEAEAGRLLMKIITNKLREESQDKAQDEAENEG